MSIIIYLLNDMNIDEIINMLPMLSQEELKKVDDTIKFYLKSIKKETHPEEVLLYDSINKKVREITEGDLFFNVFKKSKIGYKQLLECLKTLDNFIMVLQKTISITRFARKQMYNLYVEVIVEYLIKCRIPISINSILNCHEKFLSLLDKKYPGYLESGMLYLIFCNDLSTEIKNLK